MRSIALTLFVLLASLVANGQGSPSVEGTVTDSAGAPVAGVTVFIEDARIGFLTDAVTGDDGKFVFDGLPAGHYLVRAELNGSKAAADVRLSGPGKSLANLRLVYASTISEMVDVSVSAGTAQPIGEVAKSVDVIGKDEAEVRGDLSIADTLRTVPGFRVQQLGGFGRAASIKSRGLRNQDTAVLIDGMRFRDPSSITGDASAFLSDLTFNGAERIEVLRGSGSSIYGTNAIGGVIDIRSREPRPGFSGEANGGFGGLGLGKGNVSISGGSSKLLGTASFSRTVFTKGIDGNDGARNSGFRGRADFRPSRDTFISGRVMLSRAFVMLNTNPDTLGALGPGVVDAVAGVNFFPDADDPDNSQRSDFNLGRVQFSHIFSPELLLTVSYQGLTTMRRNDNGVLGPGYQPFGGTETSVFEGRIDTFESRLNWTRGRAGLSTLGFEYEAEDYRNNGFGPSQSNSFSTDAGQKSYTLYAQHLEGFFDGRLQFAGGARFQAFKVGKTNFSATDPPYADLQIADPPGAVTIDGAVSYLFRSSGTKLRVHAGNGYRVPSLYERLGTFYSTYSQEFTALGDPNLKPERSKAFDAGIDQEFAGGRARLSATYFYTVLTDTIGFGFSVPDIGSTSRPYGGYLNERGGIARGAEFTVSARPTDRTYLFASYTRTNSDQRIPQVAGSGIISTLGIPENQFTLLATQKLGKRLDLSLDLLVSGDYLAPIFSSETFSTVLYRFGGNRRADISGRYEIPLSSEKLHLVFGAVVQNLSGKEYYENGFRTEGRTARASLGVKF